MEVVTVTVPLELDDTDTVAVAELVTADTTRRTAQYRFSDPSMRSFKHPLHTRAEQTQNNHSVRAYTLLLAVPDAVTDSDEVNDEVAVSDTVHNQTAQNIRKNRRTQAEQPTGAKAQQYP